MRIISLRGTTSKFVSTSSVAATTLGKAHEDHLHGTFFNFSRRLFRGHNQSQGGFRDATASQVAIRLSLPLFWLP
jgi:hypothetical protein